MGAVMQDCTGLDLRFNSNLWSLPWPKDWDTSRQNEFPSQNALAHPNRQGQELRHPHGAEQNFSSFWSKGAIWDVCRHLICFFHARSTGRRLQGIPWTLLLTPFKLHLRNNIVIEQLLPSCWMSGLRQPLPQCSAKKIVPYKRLFSLHESTNISPNKQNCIIYEP